jgi:hypothetical protein
MQHELSGQLSTHSATDFPAVITLKSDALSARRAPAGFGSWENLGTQVSGPAKPLLKVMP